MRVNLDCNRKQALFANKSGLTLFKGEAKPAETKSQPAQDTFVKSEKPATETPKTATPEVKTAATQETKTAATPEVATKCVGPNCKDCK